MRDAAGLRAHRDENEMQIGEKERGKPSNDYKRDHDPVPALAAACCRDDVYTHGGGTLRSTT